MKQQIGVAGSGGQGVQFIGKFLAYYGMTQGKEVTYLPSYGAEMRGGSTDAQIVISDDKIGLPMISEAALVLLLSPLGLKKFNDTITENTTILYNSDLMSEIDVLNWAGDISCELIPVEADTIAREFSMEKRLVNIPFIYHALNVLGIYKTETVTEALNNILSGKEKAIEFNVLYFRHLEENMKELVQ